MNDMISDNSLDSFKMAIKSTEGKSDYSIGIRTGMQLAKSFNDRKDPDYEKATNTGWIQVDDRMPDDGELILVTDAFGDMFLTEYSQDSGFNGFVTGIDAWRPAPKPYTPQNTTDSTDCG